MRFNTAFWTSSQLFFALHFLPSRKYASYLPIIKYICSCYSANREKQLSAVNCFLPSLRKKSAQISPVSFLYQVGKQTDPFFAEKCLSLTTNVALNRLILAQVWHQLVKLRLGLVRQFIGQADGVPLNNIYIHV